MLEHELDRCRRTGALVVVAYVGVVGLAPINGAEGHSVGDKLLKRVVRRIKDRLRSYDLIIRLGDDEFVCAMSNMSLSAARERFNAIAGTLAAFPEPGAITTGFAELAPNEKRHRADRARRPRTHRQQPRHPRPPLSRDPGKLRAREEVSP